MNINITTKLSPANTTTTNTDNKKKLGKYQRIITNYRFATKPAISGDVGITPVFTLYWHIYPTTVTGIFTLKEDDATTDLLSRKNSYKKRVIDQVQVSFLVLSGDRYPSGRI